GSLANAIRGSAGNRRRVFAAHAAHCLPRYARGPQRLRCSLTQLSNALAPLLRAFHWGPRGAATGGCPWIAEYLAEGSQPTLRARRRSPLGRLGSTSRSTSLGTGARS